MINNAETYTSIPIIITVGSAAWASVSGAFDQKGIKLYNIVGDVDKVKIVEKSVGDSVNDVLKSAGVSDAVAAEIGGCTEPITFAKDFTKALGFKNECLGGVGSIVVFNKERDLKKVYLEKMEFMAEESCKQCVPCRDGSKKLFCATKELLAGCRKPDEESI